MVRNWRAKVRLDGLEVLVITAPLPVVTDALSRVLSAIEPHIMQASFLEIELGLA